MPGKAKRSALKWEVFSGPEDAGSAGLTAERGRKKSLRGRLMSAFRSDSIPPLLNPTQEVTTMSRVFNFSAGPAILPEAVLKEAQAELLDFKGSGMSIMESSHRGKEYTAVHEEAVANIVKLMGLDADHAVLFLQGGASGQFGMLPMNLLTEGKSADYTNTGTWAKKAIKEAKILGKVNVIADTSAIKPARMPLPAELKPTAVISKR